MEAKIRILLVDQVRLVGHVLAAVLEDEADMKLVGCATSVDEALSLAAGSDVILVNTRLTGGAALKIIRAVAGSRLPAKILALGLVETKEQVRPYVEAGAAGYVLADDSVHDLLERIRNVILSGHRTLQRPAAGCLATAEVTGSRRRT